MNATRLMVYVNNNGFKNIFNLACGLTLLPCFRITGKVGILRTFYLDILSLASTIFIQERYCNRIYTCIYVYNNNNYN